jgi:Phasin protein
MSQDQSISSTLNPMSFPFKPMFAKDADSVSATQKLWMETAERANRDWAALFEAEAKLGSDFMSRVTAAKTIPDVAAAYQEWMSGQIALASKKWQTTFEDSRRLANACTRVAGNGGVSSS